MRIGIITTGGTIAGSVIDDVVAARDMQSRQQQLVDILNENTRFLFRSPLSVMSENMEPTDWLRIAKSAQELSNEDIQGILVLHGTDTAAFTSAALSFLCSDLELPVVITGSNLPADQPDSDAANNMLGAIAAIANLDRGCYLSFAGDPHGSSTVFSGTHVRKLHAGGQPYRSVGVPAVASVQDGVFEGNPKAEFLLKPPSGGVGSPSSIDNRVTMCSLYPGFDFVGLQQLVDARDYKVVVLQLYGSLSAPTGTEIMDCATFVGWCQDRDVTVIGCPHEPPVGTLLDYESTVSLRKAGMLIKPNMLPEVAYVKAVSLALAGLRSDERVQEFLRPVAAEFRGSSGVGGD